MNQTFDSANPPLMSWQRGLHIYAGSLGEKLQSPFKRHPKPSDAILLAGSGRSGTTWLAELLVAKSNIQMIFEPENPSWTKEIRPLTGWGPSLRVRSFYLQSRVQNVEWFSFWQNVFTGHIRNKFTDQIRTSFFPNGYLVKMIRANLMLGYIYNNFQPKVVYTIRHPCAVITSRMALKWVADVKDILTQEELVEDHLRPWLGQIEKEKDQLGAQAVWWAVENMVAMKSLAEIPHIKVTFESLCLQPEMEVNRLRNELGIDIPKNLEPVISRPSQTSFQKHSHTSTIKRLSQWKSKLDSNSQKKILNWAHRLGIETYNDSLLPVL